MYRNLFQDVIKLLERNYETAKQNQLKQLTQLLLYYILKESLVLSTVHCSLSPETNMRRRRESVHFHRTFCVVVVA